MYSVEQALEVLKKENITNSVQMLRRWLRDDKIDGAIQKSRKTGWEIPVESLNQFIELKKNESSKVTSNVNKDSLEYSYQKGYNAALEEIKKRDYELLKMRGVSEKSFYIYRNEVFQLGERLVNPVLRKEFKKFLDDSLFKKYVKNPRQKLEIFQLGDWCMIYDTNAMFDKSEFEEMDQAFEDIFVEELLKRMLKKFYLVKQELNEK
ncbi:hypothetical protein [Carnobacterium maltaromaticum]|uniref:hypothetical protein n=1 Tax=Carnobacterium maltaromaticum TaxID=2751 RepID=UPI0012F8D379|nr:hypothetical protein [Carnobacterium maltaromaticum]